MSAHQDLKNSNAERDRKVENSCCGGSPTTREDACCLADEKAKNQGNTGCGCECSTSPNNT